MATRTAVRKRVRTRRPRWVRVIKIALATSFLLGLVGTVAFGWMFAVKLRKAEEMMPRLPSILDELGSRPTVILSSDGKRMFQVSIKNRQPVLINHVPKVVIDATLAAEDKRFYSHSGIDYISLGRSLVSNLTSGTSQGGSTITMQIVKRVFTSPAKTYDRKIQDMALAVVMERKMTKNQILQLYLNEVFYGESAYGIQAAAEVYFNKKLDQLSIAEAALLARCVRRPSEENPFRNPSRALANRDTVLAIMREEGMINSKEYEEAKGERLVLARRRTNDTAIRYRAPYAVSHVLDVIRRDLPEIDLTSGGYVIETTINSPLQKVAEKAVADVVRRNRLNKVTTGAMILTDREGRILAEVGGRDFQRNQYNVITQGHRQPGSSFKPFVYAAALANSAIGPRDTVSNARYSYTDPGTGVTWTPRNSNGKYGGNVSIESALAYSYNVAAVRVMEKAGAANVVAMGESIFGFEPNELYPYLSTALGASEVRPIEMAQGYSVFQLKGDRATPFIVTRIKDPAGNVIKEYTPNIQQGVLSRDVADKIDECLRAVARYGTGSKASSSGVRNARGKTGTTSDNKDAWFCGYTDEFLGIAWIANEVPREGRPASYLEMGRSVFGGKVTIDIWIEVMKQAQRMVEEGKFEKYDPSMDGMYQRPDASENQEPAPTLEDPQLDEPVREEILPNPDENVVDSPPIGGIPVDGGREVSAPPDKPPTTRTEPPPAAAEPEPVYALVEVCADTGRRANMYCPETVMRQFLKSETPRRNCRIHR